MQRKIDPIKGDVADFLQNVSSYEEQAKDVINPYFMEQGRLKGFATPEGTDKFYRKS